jgi:hypothetical protein
MENKNYTIRLDNKDSMSQEISYFGENHIIDANNNNLLDIADIQNNDISTISTESIALNIAKKEETFILLGWSHENKFSNPVDIAAAATRQLRETKQTVAVGYEWSNAALIGTNLLEKYQNNEISSEEFRNRFIAISSAYYRNEFTSDNISKYQTVAEDIIKLHEAGAHIYLIDNENIYTNPEATGEENRSFAMSEELISLQGGNTERDISGYDKVFFIGGYRHTQENVNLTYATDQEAQLYQIDRENTVGSILTEQFGDSAVLSLMFIDVNGNQEPLADQSPLPLGSHESKLPFNTWEAILIPGNPENSD